MASEKGKMDSAKNASRPVDKAGLARFGGVEATPEEILQFMQFTLEHMNDSVYWVNHLGKIEYVNEAACRMLGYTRDEMLRFTVADIAVNYSLDTTWPAQWGELKKTGPLYFDSLHKTKTGRTLPVEIHVSYMTFGGREYYCAFVRDISDLKQTIELLMRYELLAANSRDIMLFVSRDDGRILEANEAATAAYGYSRAELLKLTVLDLRAPEANTPVFEQMARADMEGILFETTHCRRDGSVFPVEVSSRGATINGVRTLVSVIRDISDRRKAQDALRSSEEHYRVLAENMTDTVWVMDVENNTFRYVSPSAEQLRGYSVEQILQQHLTDVLTPNSLRHIKSVLPERIERFRRGQVEHFTDEIEQYHKDGHIVYTEVASRFCLNADTGRLEVIGVSRDVSKRRQAQMLLRESQSKLSAAMESMTDAVFISDTNGYFIEFNEAFATFHRFKSKADCARTLQEYPEFLDVYMADGSLAPLNMWAVPRALRGETGVGVEYTLRRKDTGATWVGSYNFAPIRDKDGTIIGSVVVGRDISDRKKGEDALRESEARFSELARQNRTYMWEVDSQGLYTYVSDVVLAVIGYAPEELVGKLHFYDLHPPYQREAIRKAAFRIFEQRETFKNFTSEGLSKDGRQVWIATNGLPVLNPDGSLRGYRGSDTDVTEQKKAEDALRENQRFLSDLIENSAAAICTKDMESKHKLVNRKWEEVTGIKRGFAQGRKNEELFPPLVAEEFRRNDLKVMEMGTFVESDETLIDAQGATRHFLSIKFPVKDKTGAIAGVCAMSTDITDRKHAEELLRSEQERLSSIIFAANVGTWEWNVQTGEIVYNERWAAILGYTLAEISPVSYETWKKLTHPDDVSKAEEMIRRYFRKESDIYETEVRMKHKDGSWVWVLTRGRVTVWTSDGKPLIMQGAHTDITTRKRAEIELQENQRRLQAITDSAHDAIIMIDPRGLVTFWNPSAEKIFGYSPQEMLGRNLHEILTDERDRLEHLAAFPRFTYTGLGAAVGKTLELQGRCKDGNRVTVELSLSAVSLNNEWNAVGVIRDITLRKQLELDRDRLEAEFMQAQKMESVGRLAGGVAHDFNNMLGVILGNVELAIKKVDPSQKLYSRLMEIRSAAEHSADLTRQLLAFARKQPIAPKMLDLNQTVAGMLKILKRLIGENVDLKFLPDANLWLVKMDPSQIDQILANLCVNARDAIRDVGSINITLANAQFDPSSDVERGEIIAGQYVKLSVSDNGCGMNRETLAQIFEPFFTTKGPGKGTGLGLATVYGTVRQNNGFIDVVSEEGRGSTFNIFLPRHVESSAQPAADASLQALHGKETILVVEDELRILEIIATMLQGQGYTVLTVRSPDEALQLVQAHPGNIDLLLTDVIMPEMNGKELSLKLWDIRPGLKRLFMSGYTSDIIAQYGVLQEGVNFIQKPFTARALAAKVRESLDARLDAKNP